MTTADRALIAENVDRVRQRIAAAAARSGRDAGAITLLAATKYVTPTAARFVAEAGCIDLGESRPQQLWEKAAALTDLKVRWHLIGHLQRNKARRTLPLVALIHSVDSAELLADLDRLAGELSCRTKILLEVHISGDAGKDGFAPEELAPLLEQLPGYRNVEVAGLMGMASLEGGLDAARRDFARLRQLRDRLTGQLPPGVSLAELSMGMSGDFEAAIEEGATIVRVGSALFEGPAP